MAKTNRPVSRYATEAAALLGQLIRKARVDRNMAVAAVTERAGISRGLLRRIEAGDTGCAIGAVFEVAALVGVRLFEAEQATLSRAIEANRQVMTLLPKSIRRSRTKPDDDF
jgi:transcriptional regulator with XRE-family HTH domain